MRHETIDLSFLSAWFSFKITAVCILIIKMFMSLSKLDTSKWIKGREKGVRVDFFFATVPQLSHAMRAGSCVVQLCNLWNAGNHGNSIPPRNLVFLTR